LTEEQKTKLINEISKLKEKPTPNTVQN